MNNPGQVSDLLYWFGLLATLIAAWLIFRVVVRRDYLRNGSLSLLSTALEFVIFGAHANLPYLYLSTPWPGLPPLPDSSIQQVLGVAVAGGGFLATLGVMAWLGFGTTVGSQPDQLQQTGPYRWTRNPQLLTYGLILLGCVILYPSWQAAAWVALYGLISQMMVLTEEEHLTNLFENRYQDYCRRVPRYIPGIRKNGILPLEPKE